MRAPTQCIVLCGGQGTRWNGYRNSRRKHLIEVEGEMLLGRTLRLVNACASINPIVVVNRNDIDLFASQLSGKADLYGINEAISNKTDAYKFLSSQDLWNPNGRTVVLLGDVWFSEPAILTIFGDSREDWTAFGRAGPSRFTGCPHGELFAQKFTSFLEHRENLVRLDSMYRQGFCRRAGSGWAHYQLMIGRNPNIHTVGRRFVEIDDFTDDFDCPGDYDAWVQGRSNAVRMETAPVRRDGPKIGRNAPCSCGSGKKSKKCCGR